MKKSIVRMGLCLLTTGMLAQLPGTEAAAKGPANARLRMAEVRVAEATIHSIGFEWDILPPGDDDHSATALACYRKAQGANTWKSARLLRVDYQGWYRRCCEGEDLCTGSCHACDANCDPCLVAPDARCAAQGDPMRCDAGENCRDPRCSPACTSEPISCDTVFDICQTGVHGYRHFDMFAGSVMFLDPDTRYQVKLLAYDPAGHGTNAAAECAKTHPATVQTKTFQVRTRAQPRQKAGKARYVGPDLGGTCDLNHLNYCKVCGTRANPIPGFAAAEACVRKGYDRFLILPGDYYGHTFTESGAKGRHIVWKGAGGTVAAPPAPAQPSPCPSAAQESPYPLTPIVLHAQVPGHPATLVVSADRLWFEGLDLRPEMPGEVEGIVVTVRPPLWPAPKCAARAQRAAGSASFGEHCDWRGAQDIVITKNAFTDFSSAIAAGQWCTNNNEFKTVVWRADHLSLAGTAGTDKPCNEQPQDWWGEPWGGPPTDAERARKLDRRRAVMHRHWYVADNVIRYDYEGRAPNEGMYLSFLADSDIAYNRISQTPCKDPADVPYSGEPDAMAMQSATNVDVYGNDIRDIRDNGIHASWSYANLRFWRNRAINTGNSFVNFDPMGSAPWYLVRNEIVPQSGRHYPFQAAVFDRLVLVNNTFITRGDKDSEAVDPDRADLLLRSVSRNNLWIMSYENPTGTGGSAMLWRGKAATFNGSTFAIGGQTRSNWKTDLDYDGMDWDTLPDALGEPGIINWGNLWTDGGAWGRLTFLDPNSLQRSFQKFSRGCGGGPRDGLYCESDGDCESAGIVKTYPDNSPVSEEDFAAPDPNAPYTCIAAERNFRRVHRATAFGGSTTTRAEVDAYIDQYANEQRFPADRLDLECDAADPPNDCQSEGGCCPVDRGDAAFHADNSFLWRDIVAGRSQPYVTDGKPDLGAYERGQPAPHYGPRPLESE